MPSNAYKSPLLSLHNTGAISRTIPWRLLSLLLSIMCVVMACMAKKPASPISAPEPALIRLAPDQYPAFDDDMVLDGLIHGIDQSLAYLVKLPPDTSFKFGNDTYAHAHLVRSLTIFRTFIASGPTSSALSAFIHEHYRVYRSRGNDNGKVLFTGYYEPILRGSRMATAEFQVPIYGVPADLVRIDISQFAPRFKDEPFLMGRITAQNRVIPYYDRRQIEDEQVLRGYAPPIAWLNDRVDLFFLQIQGSGKVYLDDGTVLNVHYSAKNGHPYRSIGALLIRENKVPREEMSMQRIRAYLDQHPEEMVNILNYNPSYVFFQVESDGPLGALGVRLTPGRSVALQRDLFPSAALAYIICAKPLVDGDGAIQKWRPMARFALNQDTGGAIRGPARADLFWGNGPYAELAAGHMQHPGELYFLVLKPGMKLAPESAVASRP
jgi:membrane-bound lytic murein transglycosylase A